MLKSVVKDSFWQKIARSWGSRGQLLLRSGLLLFVTVSLNSPPAIATPKQVTQTLSYANGASFTDWMQQAQVQARSFIDQAFSDPGVTRVSVKIVGERNGQEAPLLFTQVSRADWQRHPRLEPWTKYFASSAIVLLGFIQPSQTIATTPPPASPPTAPTSLAAPTPPPVSSPSQVAPQVIPPNPLENDPAYRDD